MNASKSHFAGAVRPSRLFGLDLGYCELMYLVCYRSRWKRYQLACVARDVHARAACVVARAMVLFLGSKRAVRVAAADLARAAVSENLASTFNYNRSHIRPLILVSLVRSLLASACET